MHAIRQHAFGGPQEFRLETVPDPYLVPWQGRLALFMVASVPWCGVGDRSMLRVWLVGCGSGRSTMMRAIG